MVSEAHFFEIFVYYGPMSKIFFIMLAVCMYVPMFLNIVCFKTLVFKNYDVGAISHSSDVSVTSFDNLF